MYKSLAILVTLAFSLVAGAKHHHHQPADVESEPVNPWASFPWNRKEMRATVNLVKEFEGLSLTAF